MNNNLEEKINKITKFNKFTVKLMNFMGDVYPSHKYYAYANTFESLVNQSRDIGIKSSTEYFIKFRNEIETKNDSFFMNHKSLDSVIDLKVLNKKNNPIKQIIDDIKKDYQQLNDTEKKKVWRYIQKLCAFSLEYFLLNNP